MSFEREKSFCENFLERAFNHWNVNSHWKVGNFSTEIFVNSQGFKEIIVNAYFIYSCNYFNI